MEQTPKQNRTGGIWDYVKRYPINALGFPELREVATTGLEVIRRRQDLGELVNTLKHGGMQLGGFVSKTFINLMEAVLVYNAVYGNRVPMDPFNGEYSNSVSNEHLLPLMVVVALGLGIEVCKFIVHNAGKRDREGYERIKDTNAITSGPLNHYETPHTQG